MIVCLSKQCCRLKTIRLKMKRKKEGEKNENKTIQLDAAHVKISSRIEE